MKITIYILGIALSIILLISGTSFDITSYLTVDTLGTNIFNSSIYSSWIFIGIEIYISISPLLLIEFIQDYTEKNRI